MLPIEDAKEHGEEGNGNEEQSDTCETEVPVTPEQNMVCPQFTPEKTSAETPDYRFRRAICDDADASIDASVDIASRGCSDVQRKGKDGSKPRTSGKPPKVIASERRRSRTHSSENAEATTEASADTASRGCSAETTADTAPHTMVATYRNEEVIGGIGPAAGLLPTNFEEAKCARCGDVLIEDRSKMSGKGKRCVICKTCNSKGAMLGRIDSWKQAIVFFCGMGTWGSMCML